MRDGKLITVLKTFDSKQFKRLLSFAQSPYFNKNTEIVSFLTVLFKIYPDWEEIKLEEEYLYKKTFPHSPFDKKRLYYLRSYTLTLLEQFLVHEAVETEPFEASYKLLKFYQKHQLNDYFEQSYEQMQQLLAKTPVNNDSTNYNRFLLAWEGVHYQLRSKERAGNLNLTETHHYLDIFYFLNKLSLHISGLSFAYIGHSSENQGIDLSQILAIIPQTPHLATHHSLRFLYNYVNLLLFPNHSEHQEKAWESLNEDHKQLPLETIKGLYAMLRNFYISQINKGDVKASQRLFEIYDKQLQNGFLLNEKQEIPLATFQNIATLGLKLRHFEWVKAFIEKYSKYLENTDNNSVNVLHFVWAKYHFEIGKYTEVLKYLHQITEFAHHLLDIQARKLLMQTYYELEDIESVLVQVNSFRVYLSRNQNLTEDRKRTYQNFAAAMNKLALTDFLQAAKKKQSYQFIQKMEDFAEKAWFLGKIVL